MQGKQTSTTMLVKEAVFTQGFHLSFQSYFCLFPDMYFKPQEYPGVLAAPCTHLWFHVVFLLSFCLCLKHPASPMPCSHHLSQ